MPLVQLVDQDASLTFVFFVLGTVSQTLPRLPKNVKYTGTDEGVA